MGGRAGCEAQTASSFARDKPAFLYSLHPLSAASAAIEWSRCTSHRRSLIEQDTSLDQRQNERQITLTGTERERERNSIAAKVRRTPNAAEGKPGLRAGRRRRRSLIAGRGGGNKVLLLVELPAVSPPSMPGYRDARRAKANETCREKRLDDNDSRSKKPASAKYHCVKAGRRRTANFCPFCRRKPRRIRTERSEPPTRPGGAVAALGTEAVALGPCGRGGWGCREGIRLLPRTELAMHSGRFVGSLGALSQSRLHRSFPHYSVP